MLNIEKGSFVITIEQIIEFAPVLLPCVPTVIDAFKEIVKIRNFLNGKPPKNVESEETKIKLENEHGDIYYANNMTFNVFTNDVEKGFANTAKAVFNDKDRKGLIYDFVDDNGDEEQVKLDRKKLSNLSVPQDVEKFRNDIEENEVTTWVKVNKPDLHGKSRWGMSFNGKNIYCIMSDQAFLDKVHNEQVSFKSNTKLYVKMIVRYKDVSSAGNCSSEVISYDIVQVLDISTNN